MVYLPLAIYFIIILCIGWFVYAIFHGQRSKAIMAFSLGLLILIVLAAIHEYSISQTDDWRSSVFQNPATRPSPDQTPTRSDIRSPDD